MFGLGPLGPFQFHRQLDPLVDQFAQPLVGGHLLAHLLHLFGANEAGAALAPPGKAELVVGPVFAGILGVFAAAAGCAADVVLLADTARMERPHKCLIFAKSELEKCFVSFNYCRACSNLLVFLGIEVWTAALKCYWSSPFIPQNPLL